jgi:hypothetical protein
MESNGNFYNPLHPLVNDHERIINLRGNGEDGGHYSRPSMTNQTDDDRKPAANWERLGPAPTDDDRKPAANWERPITHVRAGGCRQETNNENVTNQFYNPLHPLVNVRKKKFSVRIGTATGLDGEESERIIGEGMTLFRNTVPSELLKEKGGMTDTWEPKSLRHLELEIENFRKDMPIMPHTDRKNCPHDNFNILACTSKFFQLADKSIVRLGGLLYFREVCSHFLSRTEIGGVIEQNLKNKLREMPIELREVNPHVPHLLQSKEGGIFSLPPHLNKCMYFSILVDRITLVSTVHHLTLPRRVELCSITLALNGMDLPWEILTRWAESSKLPRRNLFMAFVEAATKNNHGTICSNSSFRRSQPSNNRPKSLPEILFMNQVSRSWLIVNHC